MDFFGELFIALIGVAGTLLSAVAFLLKRWMSALEKSNEALNANMRQGFERVYRLLESDYLPREQHMQLHAQLQDTLARMITRDNRNEAMLKNHEERISRLERKS